MTEEFKADDRVTVSLTGMATVDWVSSDGKYADVRLDNNDEHTLEYIPVYALTHADPADWPPRSGDVWEAGGRTFLIMSERVNSHPGYKIVARSDDSSTFYGQTIGPTMEDFKALRPVKKYRKPAA